MGASLSFLKHPTVAISAILLMLICSSCCSISAPSSIILLTLLALLLSTSFPSFFLKIRQLGEASAKRKPIELEVGLEILPPDDLVLEGEKPTEAQAFECEAVEDQVSAGFVEEYVVTENPSCSPSEISDFSASDNDDDSSRENIRRHSEDSISDDDSLIEITLPDGHYVAPEKPDQPTFHQSGSRGGFLPNFSPESLFRQHGLMELLAEIYEEDNMIEIDITRGSIKCSRLEIKA